MQWRFVITSLVLTASIEFAGRSAGAADQAPAPPRLGEEARPEGEETSIKELVDVQNKIMKIMYKNPDLNGRRAQHPKQHGCVLATFTVLGGLPDDLKFGLFK